MKRIYLAGPYSSGTLLECLSKMRRGMRVATKVFLAGYSPWTPWHDFHHHLMLNGDEELTIDDYHRYSMDWLEVADAVLMVDGWEQSKGANAERTRAIELGIPIFYSLDELKNAI